MAEKKQDPRPKWSSKKYKNYGEFNKAVLNWRERNNKGYKWNKKDVVWETRNGKRVPVDRNTNKVLKSQERGIPGFVQDHINPLVIDFSNKPFGFDYDKLTGSDVYDEERRKFLTKGELEKDEKMRAEGRRIDEDLDQFETGEERPTEELKVKKKKKEEKKEEKKNNYTNEGGGNEAGGGENKINEGGAGAAAFGGGDENTNYPSIADMGSNKAQTNETKSADNVGPARMTAREKMRAQNVERFGGGAEGEAHVAHLEKQNTAFQSMKRGEITKEQFVTDFPKSQTAKAERKKKLRIGKK